MPKVSVLSPTYQHADFIGDCIRSVLAQSEQDWEMIIVDDGSDDGTPDIAESFNDPRIVVVRQNHEGVSGLGRSYATAVARANSPLLAILEGDDTWPVTKLEDEIPLFDDPAVVLAYGSAGLIDKQGCTYAHYWHAPRGKVARNDPIGVILPSLFDLDFIVAVTVMIRRSALEEIGGFIQPSGVPYVDHPTWLRLATIGTFARLPNNLGNWRRHSSQITTQSWFDAAPSRKSYLQDAATHARDVTTDEVMSALAVAIEHDVPRQREEILTARGRVALLDGRWAEARQTFLQLLSSGGLQTRMAAVVGLLCCVCRTDMERVISTMGRHSLPSRRHSALHTETAESHWLKRSRS
jgi:hypothetical protein